MTIDFLYEDPIIPQQQYGIISYLLPKELENMESSIAIKFRGAFNGDKVNKKIEELKNKDPNNVSIYKIEIGKWTELATKNTILKWEEDGLTDIVHSDERLNEILRKTKEEQKKASEYFELRKKEMMEKAMIDGTKEGQEALSAKRENPLSIKDRLNANKEELINLEKQVGELKNKIKLDTEKLKTYSDADIGEYEKELAEHYKNL
jgi:hypothetical protein